MTGLYMLCFVALTVLCACAPPVQPRQSPASLFAPPYPSAKLEQEAEKAKLQAEVRPQEKETVAQKMALHISQ